MAIAALVVAVAPVEAQKSDAAKKYKENYNYRRAKECIDNGDYKDADAYLERAIADDPNNGYAHLEKSVLYGRSWKFEESLASASTAVRLAGKDYELLESAYYNKSWAYLCLNDIPSAMADADKCIEASLNREPKSSLGYELKAYLCLSCEQYEEVLSYCNAAMKVCPYKPKVYLYSSTALRFVTPFDAEKALSCINKAIMLTPNNYSYYLERARTYLAKGDLVAAVNDAIYVLEKSESYSDTGGAQNFLSQNFENSQSTYEVENSACKPEDLSGFQALVDLKLRAKMIDNPNVSNWPDVLAQIHISKNECDLAIPYLKKQIEIEESNRNAIYQLAYCYNEICDYDNALEYANKYIAVDSTSYNGFYIRAKVKESMRADVKSTIADFDKVVELNPNASTFYNRGWYERYNGMKEEAVEDLSEAIQRAPDHSHYRLTRGNILAELGEKDMAKEDYEAVLTLVKKQEDNESNKGNIDYEQKAYALFYLGRPDEAIDVMNKALSLTRPEYKESAYYNLACLYSLMGKVGTSLDNLRECLERGYRDFTHIRRDNDLDNIRKSPDFEPLVAKYEQKAKDALDASKSKENKSQTAKAKGSVSEVAFSHDNGVLTVPCVVNGVPLTFIFDSGAADVTISLVEAQFLYKNGYLLKSDLGDKAIYGDANGDISVGQKILLRSVTFGGETLTNVRASIVVNQRAPLLLGQSVMNRLGKVEIDYTKQVIRITAE